MAVPATIPETAEDTMTNENENENENDAPLILYFVMHIHWSFT